jgi:tape measure domain-containing protein
MGINNIVYKISAIDLLTPALKGINSEASKADKTMSSFKKTIGAALSVAAIYEFGKEIIETTNKLEALQNQLNFAAGSAVKGGKDFEYIKDLANKLGLEFESAADAFAKFEGATRGTTLAGKQTKDIFEGVAAAGTVMHLSADQMGGALTAIQQMVSKGKVSAEELNGQLGERLPGALGIAARSMGMTTSGLMDMMKQGKLLSEDFLPKFAKQLSEEFGPGLETASKSGMAQMNRLTNNILYLKQAVGESTKGIQSDVIEGITTMVKLLMDNMDAIKSVLAPIWDAVINGFGKIKTAVMDNIGIFDIYFKYFEMIKPTLIIIIDIIADVIAETINLIGFIITLLDKIGMLRLMYNIFINLVNVIKPVWELVKDILDLIMAIITLDWGKAWDSFVKGASDLWASLKAIWDLLTFKHNESTGGSGNTQNALDYATGTKANIFGSELAGNEINNKNTKKIPNAPTQTKGVSGPKITTINISMENLIKTFTVQPANMSEGSNDIKNLVTSALAQALNDAQLIVR